jgi:eukaryotic-like serine/threonine-protein kinase
LDLRAQLQEHLGSAFIVERELGGGGMSRVFVANEVRLSRRVVVKVLSPELAQGLNAERFEREILLAASLQQANIVPVLAAGDINGLPYFTMPFIEGESLRTRLTGSGLPIQDVIAILRDVTKALAYAHARNIVHRDIKPDNVLLSGGTAVVTDFGIAKALSASRTAGTGATLTSIGTSIGTPAYMAPEQVAGDPNLDHRVDLYALGCMAQELLTGRAPFADRTPQKMLAAHLSEAAIPVSTLRPDCPPGLAALVTQLLRKDPADRPASANDVLRALDALSTSSSPTLALNAPGALPKVLAIYVVATLAVAVVAKACVVGIGLPDWVFPGAVAIMLLGFPALLITAYVKRVARHAVTATPTLTPGGTMLPKAPSGTMATMALKASPHVSWRKTTRVGMLAMSGFVLVVIGFMAMRTLGIGSAGSLFAKGQLAADDRIVLADFSVAHDDSALAPILAAAVRAAMSQSKSVRLMDQADIAQTLQQMQRERGTPLVPDLAREVAVRAGAKAVLGGQLARIGAGYVVSLDLTSADRGVSLASFQATANGAKELLAAVDQVTRDLRGKIGESLRQVQRSIPLQQATTSSLEALRKYSEASVANDVDGDYDKAVRLSREAVALDSTFALGWRKLAVALSNGQGSAAAQDTALRKAFQYADRLPDAEKYLAIGVYYAHSLQAGDRGKTLAAYQSAYAADSNSAIAANNLMTLYESRIQFDSGVRYGRRQFAIEPNAAAGSYVASALLLAGKVDEAAALLDSLHKAAPQSDNFDGVYAARILVYMVRGRHDSLARLVATMLASPSPATRFYGIGNAENVEITAGRLTKGVALDHEKDVLLVGRGAASAFDGLAQAATDIWFRGRHAEGIRELDAVVSGKQWSAAPAADRPYFQVASLYAQGGQPDRARGMLARFDAESPSAKAPSARPGLVGTQAEIALADKKYDEAVRLFRAADVAEDGAPYCPPCTEFNVARAFDAAGNADSTFAHFSAYLGFAPVLRLTSDYTDLALAEKRLGELYDAKHDKTNALKYYGAFVELWKGADPDLQPVVATVKKRMGELAAREGKAP